MIINKILIIIIIIYLLFLHNKKKYIEKFSLTDNIKTVVNKIYNNELEPIFELSNLFNGISRGNDLYISNNLNISGNIYSKKDIKKNQISLNTIKSNADNHINYLNTTETDITSTERNISRPSVETYLADKNWLSFEIAQNRDNQYKLTVNTTDDNLPMIDNRTKHPKVGWPQHWWYPFEYKWRIRKYVKPKLITPPVIPSYIYNPASWINWSFFK